MSADPSKPHAHFRLRFAALSLFLAMAPAGAAAVAPLSPVRAAAKFADDIVAPDAVKITVTLTNISRGLLKLFSHVETHERHYDPFTVELAYPSPSREGCLAHHAGRKTRTLSFVDDRDKSAPVYVKLAAGETLSHTIDLSDWALRKANGALPLGPGFYKVRVKYTTAGEGSDVWPGTILSPEVRLTVSGTPTGDMCPKNPGWEMW